MNTNIKALTLHKSKRVIIPTLRITVDYDNDSNYDIVEKIETALKKSGLHEQAKSFCAHMPSKIKNLRKKSKVYLTSEN